MKHIKKLMALVIAIVMCLGMSTMVFAASEYSIKVTNDNEAMSINGKTYSAYKLFDVKYSGNNYSYTIKTTNPFYSTADAKAVLDTYFDFADIASDTTTKTVTVKESKWVSAQNKTLSDADVRALADALQPYISGNPAGSGVAANESATIEVPTAGYYIVTGTVKPTDPANSDKEVVSAVILDNADPTAEVKPKASVPPLDKKITKVQEGTTDVTADNKLDEAGKAAVAKVGSTVSYELDSNAPDLTGYSDYKFIFKDSITSGLEYVKNSFKLKVGSGAAADITPTFATDNKSFTYTIPYNTLKTYTKGDPIVLTYDCKVTSAALTYDFENNTAKLEYSKSPYSTETNETPEKKTYVIDLNLDVNKVAETANGTALTGAKFKLRKSETEYYKWDSASGVTWVTEANADVFETNEGKLTQQVRGLDNGTYYLVETEAPTGYNPLKEPITVVIKASKTDNTVTYTATAGGETAAVTNGTIDLTKAQENNKQPVVTATVINKTGAVLPGTGGIGTVIFYVLGSLLVVGCGIVLISKRRMKSTK